MKILQDYEYHSTSLGTLYLGTNKDILSLLNNDIKLCFTSPLYNIGQAESRRSDFFYSGDSKNQEKVYDTVDDNLPDDIYQLQQHELLEDIYNILRIDGAIFYNHKPRIKNGVWDDRKNLIPETLKIRQEIVWNKMRMINFNGTFFANNTERIYIIAKDQWKPNEEYLKLGEVWSIPNDLKNWHPAPFPLQLAMSVILSSTDKGDIVLDPYSGSGTVAVACERLGRKWVGIETSENYCHQSIKRIKQEAEQIKFL